MQRGDPMKLNFEDLEMQKWNIRTDGAQRNMVICLIIDLLEFFQEMVWLIDFGVTVSEISRVQMVQI